MHALWFGSEGYSRNMIKPSNSSRTLRNFRCGLNGGVNCRMSNGSSPFRSDTCRGRLKTVHPVGSASTGPVISFSSWRHCIRDWWPRQNSTTWFAESCTKEIFATVTDSGELNKTETVHVTPLFYARIRVEETHESFTWGNFHKRFPVSAALWCGVLMQDPPLHLTTTFYFLWRILTSRHIRNYAQECQAIGFNLSSVRFFNAQSFSLPIDMMESLALQTGKCHAKACGYYRRGFTSWQI